VLLDAEAASANPKGPIGHEPTTTATANVSAARGAKLTHAPGDCGRRPRTPELGYRVA
jgi:hypothetical protein